MVDAALIELEGVIFETRDLRRACLYEALRQHGLMYAISGESVDGMTPRAAAAVALAAQNRAHDEVLLDLVALTAERSFSARLASGGAALRDGARDFVREAAATARLAIVTRARRTDAETMIRLASLAEFFTTAITADDVLDAKPSSEGHRMAIDRLNRQRALPAAAAIALEDGEAGIRSARSAGIRCIAVGGVPAHIAMEADAFVPTLGGQTIRALDRLSRPGQERVQ